MPYEKNIIEEKCFQLLDKAIGQESTDIHLIPSENNYQIHFNCNTKLRKIKTIPLNLADRMISFFKFQASLDISEKRKPQSGSFHKKIMKENFSFRISTIPSIHYKESIVIRIQKHNRIVPLDQLCIEKEWEFTFKNICKKQQGLVLFSGPTGNHM